MDLSKLISAKAESAKYMVDEITNVIKTCKKRAPGSEGEKESIDYMAKELDKYTDEVKIEPFKLREAGFFGWLNFSIPAMFVTVICYFFMPILCVPAIIFGLFFMIGEFIMYKETCDCFFSQQTSHNITAVLHPSGEVKKRIFYNGHPDAAYEWTFNYKFGGKGYTIHVISAIVGIFYMIGIVIASLIANGIGFEVNTGIWRILGYIGLAFVPSWILMFKMSDRNTIVDGANDNLTGCYMGIAVLKGLKDNGIVPEHTEVGVIISGSEEAGLRGAKAWCKAHKGEYEDVDTYIFAYDTIHEAKFLAVNMRDLNMTVKADKVAADLFVDSAAEVSVHCDRGNVPFGATDSAAFNQGGFKAVGITAMDHDLQDYYHTRRDTYDNLDADCLADCYAVSVKMLEKLENECK